MVKKQRGRPMSTEKRDPTSIKLSAEEREAFGMAAAIEGMPVSVWMRSRLRTAARSEITKSGGESPV